MAIDAIVAPAGVICPHIFAEVIPSEPVIYVVLTVEGVEGQLNGVATRE